MQGEVGSRGRVPGSVLAELSGCRRVSATSYVTARAHIPRGCPGLLARWPPLLSGGVCLKME